MKTDWKDMLSSLKRNLPESEESGEINLENDKNKKEIQTGNLTVLIDRKGRNGKTATLIEGFTLPLAEVEEIARKIKNKLGVGGSTREGEILIQGNHLEKVKNILKDWNFKVR